MEYQLLFTQDQEGGFNMIGSMESFKQELLNDLKKRIERGNPNDGYSVYDNWKWENYDKLRKFEAYCDNPKYEDFYMTIFKDAIEIYHEGKDEY